MDFSEPFSVLSYEQMRLTANHVDRQGSTHLVTLDDDIAWEFANHVCDV